MCGKKISETVTNFKDGFNSQSPLFRGVVLLGSGSAIAQLISIGALPIITRIYSPTEIGILSVFVSILGIISVASCLGYEPSFSVAKTEKEALNLFVLAYSGLLSFTVIFSIGLFWVGEEMLSKMTATDLIPYMWIFPVGLLTVGNYTILNFWAIRERNYQGITETKVFQSGAGASAKIILGLLGLGATGLIVGQVISQFAGIITLYKASFHKRLYLFKEVNLQGIKSVLVRYKSFPLFNLPAAIMDSLAIGLPAILILLLFDAAAAGQYGLAVSVIGLPFRFIASSIAQPYLGEASKHIREKSPELKTLYLSLTKKLIKYSIPLVLPISLLGPFLFPIFFGESWKIAGFLCIPLALRVIPGIVINPTSYGLSIYGYNHWLMGWDLLKLILIVGGFYLSYIMSFSLFQTVTVFGFLMFISYLIMGLMNLLAIDRCMKNY